MKRLTVFYDHNCGLCRTCRRWLLGQPAYFELEFIPYDSLTARALCPEIGKLDPARQILAMADNGDLYRGGAAWVMCLYATRRHRPLAMRLGSPLLMPLAEKICAAISGNRLQLSRLLHLKSDRELGELAAGADAECKGGTCHV